MALRQGTHLVQVGGSKARHDLAHTAIHRVEQPQLSGPEPISPITERRRRARDYVEPLDKGLIVTNRYGRPVLTSDFHQNGEGQ